jgi:hypothetical protein
MKISAKVPMNRAVKARAEPVAASVTDNYLQTWPADWISTIGADLLALSPKLTRLALRYSAVHLLPVNLRKSS